MWNANSTLWQALCATITHARNKALQMTMSTQYDELT